MSSRPIPTVGAHLSPEEKELFDRIADSAGESSSWIAAQVLRHWMLRLAEGREGLPPRKGKLEKPGDMNAFRAKVMEAIAGPAPRAPVPSQPEAVKPRR